MSTGPKETPRSAEARDGHHAQIVIRPYEVADAPAVWKAVRESMNELMPWMPWCHPNYSIEDSTTWLSY